jgi:hypothetical protein
MKTNSLILPIGGVRMIIEDVARFGACNVETGGFLLASRETELVTTIGLAGTRGIERRRGLFQVSELTLDRLFGYADEHDLWIPAQYHSHGRRAFMSPTDVDHGLSVAGFVSTIVPFYATPPADAARGGWWRYDDEWVAIDPPRVDGGGVDVITFDEDGISGH